MPQEKRPGSKKVRHKQPDALSTAVISPHFALARDAILADDFERFVAFLEEYQIGVNDLEECGGSSLLMVAAECGHYKFVQELVQRGANVDYQDSDDWTALMTAAKEGHLDIVTELLDAGTEVDSRDMGGWTALMWACYKGSHQIVQALLRRNASPNITDDNHMSCLIWTAGRGHLEVVNELVAHGAKVEAGDKYGTTALIWACRKGYYEIIKKLLKSGANVDATGMFGWTPLIVATRGNFSDIVEMLLSYKPNVNACDAQGLSPLMTACKEGNIDIVNALLHANSYVNLSDRNNDTSLIHAAKSGFVLIVEALIKAHADVDHQGNNRKTALYWAVEKGHTDVVKALLKTSPNLELSNKDGDTPLMKAVRCRRIHIVKMLLDKKIKVLSVDKYGDTVLHIAARAQSKAIMELLLSNPRNAQLLYKPNKRGETPFAIDSSHQKPILPTLFGAAPSSRKLLEKETQLGYDLYSSAMANLISEPTLKTPICVGLYAKWGSGKSFLIGKLKEDLIAFTQDWGINPNFKFTWTVFFTVVILSLITGISVLIGSNEIVIAGIVTGSCFLLPYLFLVIVYCGHLRYHWSISPRLRAKLDQMKLVVQICFGHPPRLDSEQLSSLPVRFYFMEHPVKISTDCNVYQLVEMILNSLWSSLESNVGFFTIRLYRVFRPKHVSTSTWKWRKICCFVPNVVMLWLLFSTLALSVSLFASSKMSVANTLDQQPVVGSLLLTILTISAIWILTNIIIPFKILKELLWPGQKKTREALKKEVDLLLSCVTCLDAFNGKRQTRLAIILDALESIYESERLVSFFEAVNVYFLNSSNPAADLSPNFVVVLALDPHHHITSKSKEYLKTIVHLPFYLQNSQLRRVRISQLTASKGDHRSSTASLVDAIASAQFPPTHSRLNRTRSKKSGSVIKSADSVISLSGPTGDAPTKVLLTDDYFSDVNPKSLRRIMNIIYIQGRLLKAFNIDFNWHRLTTWVNITEQWPLRASAFIVFFEMYESKYNDDAIPLKTIFDKVSNILSTARLNNDCDNDEKKLGIFLSYHQNMLTIGDLKIFAPFTINLDPHLRKSVQDILCETSSHHQPTNVLTVPSQTAPKAPPVIVASVASPENTVSVVPDRSKLAELNVEGVISLLKQIDGFDVNMVETYAKKLRAHNINGRVLANCSDEDFNDLKSVLSFSFGDWLLFKKSVRDGRFLYRTPIVQISAPVSPAPTPQPVTTENPPLLRLQSNLERQVTMEGTALASAVNQDSPPPIESGSDELNINGEVGVLYIGSTSNCLPRISPSISFNDADFYSNVTNRAADAVPEPDDKTPLVSPSKQSLSSSSSSSSGKRRPLERQTTLDQYGYQSESKETVL